MAKTPWWAAGPGWPCSRSRRNREPLGSKRRGTLSRNEHTPPGDRLQNTNVRTTCQAEVRMQIVRLFRNKRIWMWAKKWGLKDNMQREKLWFVYFSMAQLPLVGKGPYFEASRSHSDTSHSVGLLWTNDQPDAETSTWKHTTQTRQTSMPPAESERPQTHALDRAAIRIGCNMYSY
jgi:hypothetical protein